MRLVSVFLFTVILSAQSPLRFVSGSLQNGAGVGVTGTAVISLPPGYVNNLCTAPNKVVSMFSTTTPVLAGTLTPIGLYPSACLSNGAFSAATYTLLSGAGSGATAILFNGNYVGQINVTAGTNSANNSIIVKLGLTIPALLQCYVIPANSEAIGANAKLQSTVVARSRPTQISRYLAIVSTAPLSVGLTYIWTFSCSPLYTVTVTSQAGVVLYTGQWLVPGGGSTDITNVDTTQIGALQQ